MKKIYKIIKITSIIVAIILFTIAIILNYSEKKNNKKTSHEDPTEEQIRYEFETNKDASKNNNEEDKQGNRTNISKKIKETHTYQNLEINNFSITSPYKEKDKAVVVFKIKNNSENDMTNIQLRIDFLDSSNSIKTYVILPVELIKANETVEVSKDILYRIIDAYDYSFELTEVHGA